MGIIKALKNNDLVNGVDNEEVYPVVSDLGLYNINNVASNKYLSHININTFTDNNKSFNSKSEARQAVNPEYRHNGLIITYLLGNTWISEQFIINYNENCDWTANDSWRELNGSSSSITGYINTNSEASLDAQINEPINGVINLHKVSKTGQNSDLVNYVGIRSTTGEKFNDYTNNVASGEYSHSEGYSTQALSNYTHVEGHSNIAKTYSDYSHIEGFSNIIESSQYFPTPVVHIEGESNKVAKGRTGHIEGTNNEMWHNYVHIQGMGNESAGRSMHIFGEYSDISHTGIDDTNRGTYVEVVGNGTNSTNKSNARLLKWNGTEWLQTDVMCGGSITEPTHKLSTKFGSSDLVNEYTTSDATKPASSKAVNDLFQLIQGAKKAYWFNTALGENTETTKSMVASLLDQSSTAQVYEVGSQLLIKESGVCDFWICEVSTTYTSASFDDNDSLEDATETSCWIGKYRVAQLESKQIDISGYQRKLIDDNDTNRNLKTICGKSILYSAGDDTTDLNPSINTIVPGANNLSYPVNGTAVINYVRGCAASWTDMRIIRTDYTESLTPTTGENIQAERGENITDGDVIKFHKISKTGKNTDLIDYVGKQAYNRNDINNIIKVNGSHIFNDYSEDENRFSKVYGTYSNSFGSKNSILGNYSIIGGKGNINESNYSFTYGLGLLGSVTESVEGQSSIPAITAQTVLGKYNTTENRNQAYFIIGNGTSNSNRSDAIYIGTNNQFYSNIIMSMGGMVSSDPNDATSPLVATITPTAGNHLVHKYYVDNAINALNTSGLYKGYFDGIPDSFNNSNTDNGTLFNIKNFAATDAYKFTYYNGAIACTYSTVNAGVNDQYFLTLKDTGNIKLIHADLLTFTTDTNKINQFNVFGGAKQNKEAVYLHKIAQTGNYNDLTNTPTIPSEQAFIMHAVYTFPVNSTHISSNIDGINVTGVSYSNLVNELITLHKIGVIHVKETHQDTTNSSLSISSWEDTYILNHINNLENPVKYEFIFTKVNNDKHPTTNVSTHDIKTIKCTIGNNQSLVWSYLGTSLSNNFNDLYNTPSFNNIDNAEVIPISYNSPYDAIDTPNNPAISFNLPSGYTYSSLKTKLENNKIIIFKIPTSYVQLNSTTNLPEYDRYLYIVADYSDSYITGVYNIETVYSGYAIKYCYELKISSSSNTITYTSSNNQIIFSFTTNANSSNTKLLQCTHRPSATASTYTLNLNKVAATGNYNDLLNKPTLATVATSGSYNDLSDKPVFSNKRKFNTLTVNSNTAIFDFKQLNNTTNLPIESINNLSVDANTTLSFNVTVDAVGTTNGIFIDDLSLLTHIIRIQNTTNSTRQLTLSNSSDSTHCNLITTSDTYSLSAGEYIELSCILVPTLSSTTGITHDLCVTIYEGMQKIV